MSRKKKLGYYEIESIDNPCYVTIAVNPKEHFEVFKNQKTNKKHKGIKKGSYGIEFNNFAGRIKSRVNFDTFQKPPAESTKRSLVSLSFKAKWGKNTVQKTKFSQLNDKRLYFPNSIVSLPYGHQNLKKIDDFKWKGAKNRKIFFDRKGKPIKCTNLKEHWKIHQDFISTTKF